MDAYPDTQASFDASQLAGWTIPTWRSAIEKESVSLLPGEQPRHLLQRFTKGGPGGGGGSSRRSPRPSSDSTLYLVREADPDDDLDWMATVPADFTGEARLREQTVDRHLKEVPAAVLLETESGI